MRIGRGLAALALAAGLAGCVLPGGGGNPLSRVPVLGGAVTVVPPAGYCIEPASRLERDDTALLLAGRCTGQEALPPAVLVATVGAAGSGAGVDVVAGGAELAGFFRSDPGRAALSARGRAPDVTVLEARGNGEAFFLRFADAGRAGGGAVQPDGWRALFPVAGRLVSLSVSGTPAAPLGRDGGYELITAFAAATRAANLRAP